MNLEEKQRLRLAFLNELYELSPNGHDMPIFGGDIASKIGMTDMNEAYGVVKYLIGEELVKDGNIISQIPGYVKITHYGITQVESANLNPDQPTNHFLPMNILFVNNMIGSSVQQGTTQSNQTATYTHTGSLEKLAEFVRQVESNIDQISLSPDALQELQSEIDTIKSQLRSPKPKTTIIKEVLGSTRTILEAATGGTIAAQLAQYIPTLLATL